MQYSIKSCDFFSKIKLENICKILYYETNKNRAIELSLPSYVLKMISYLKKITTKHAVKNYVFNAR
jgi:hypothetical protein